MKAEEALARIQLSAGKTLRAILDESGTQFDINSAMRSNKGFLGMALEHLLDLATNSRQEPDLEDGTEIKKVSIKKLQSRYTIKETVKITMISRTLEPGSFEESHLFQKTRRILLIPTLYAGAGNQENELILPPALWQPDEEFNQRLKSDFELVASVISDPARGFRSLSGAMGDLAQPRTNGPANSDSRAFYFTKRALRLMLGENYLGKL